MVNYTNTTVNDTITTQANVKWYFEYTEWKVYEFIMETAAFIPSSMGIVGSCFILLIVRKLRPFNSTSVYILVLALDDLCVSIVRCFLYSPLQHENSKGLCSSLGFLMSTTSTYSNFILMGWTIERFIAIHFPLKVADWCSIRKTIVELLILSVLSIVLNIPYTIVFEPRQISDVEDEYNCYPKVKYEEFLYKTWYFIDNTYYIYVPMGVILIANFLIIFKLREMGKRHKSMTSNTDIKQTRRREQRGATITLVSICAAFAVFHVPQAVQTVYQREIEWATLTNETYARTVMTVTLLAHCTMYQNAVNFVLYCLTGRKFRNIFMQIVCPCREVAAGVSERKSATATTGINSVSKSVDAEATSSNYNAA